MNFRGHLIMWCTLFITNHYLTEASGECVQRRLGACKALDLRKGNNYIFPRNFHSPQQEGFALKTSIEINLLENKHSFENHLQVEKKRPIGYYLDNAVVVTIEITMEVLEPIHIILGQKYYRLAELSYFNYETGSSVTKYNRYTPILPTFPYNLQLEMTTNGTFSAYADGNIEPFLDLQINDDNVVIHDINIQVPLDQTDLIAFVDCSRKYKLSCGTYRIDRLCGCREWFVRDNGYPTNLIFKSFQKTYRKGVIFDEFIVVDTEYSSTIRIPFEESNNELTIDFNLDSIWAGLTNGTARIKSVRTKQWFDVLASPYAVRVLITNGENDNFLIISNLRRRLILSLDLCQNMINIPILSFNGPKLYFDCLSCDHVDSSAMTERPRKSDGNESELEYHENDGFNFRKTLLDTYDFVSKPNVVYTYEFGNTTKDWCPGTPKPKVLVESKYADDPLQAVIQKSNEAILLALEKVNEQINATAAAVLTELKKIRDTTSTIDE